MSPARRDPGGTIEGDRFDDLTKALAGRRSRRSVLGLLGAAVGGVLAGASRADAAPPPDKPSKCYGGGSSCTNAKQCCSGTCTNRRCVDDSTPPQCEPANCPGQDTECLTRICVGGTCGLEYAFIGTPTLQQVQGDCQRTVCNGMGEITFVYDANDVPTPPGQCISGFCGPDGMPYFEPVQADSPCDENGGVVCDGDGACVVP